MNIHRFEFAGAALSALPTGALFWEEKRLLCVSDLHLCKAVRMARRGGEMLPPYETRDTLMRLDADIAATRPDVVVCLGDSFDDAEAARAMDEADRMWLARLMAGRRWIWIEGNHDPGALGFDGSYMVEFSEGPLTFRHIAATSPNPGEVSGHYHPKARISARGKTIARPCFMADNIRLMLPAYGTYTGGLNWTDPALRRLFPKPAQAFLTGQKVYPVPVP